MAPTATSSLPDLLEHPAEAFAEFRSEGVAQVVCEEKHMGSRAIAVVCRDAEIARSRFGVTDGSLGALYTRTGRPFLDDGTAALDRLRAAVSAAGLWDDLDTGWLVLDCEILPWSAKAMELIRRQYAAVGAAGAAGLSASVSVLERSAARGLDVGGLLDATRDRVQRVDAYRAAYGRYVWPVGGLEDLRVAPFHVLAAESGVFSGRDHGWHLTHCDALVEADPAWIRRTERRVVSVTDPESEAEATAWWESLTASGGEGMVVKPYDFTARGRRGLVQPGIKVRGREYLRIIYGPEYDAPSQLPRLRSRGLGRKRSLASREFALGVEAWSASCAVSRSTGSTSASSRCWLWSPSRWTRGSECGAVRAPVTGREWRVGGVVSPRARSVLGSSHSGDRQLRATEKEGAISRAPITSSAQTTTPPPRRVVTKGRQGAFWRPHTANAPPEPISPQRPPSPEQLTFVPQSGLGVGVHPSASACGLSTPFTKRPLDGATRNSSYSISLHGNS